MRCYCCGKSIFAPVQENARERAKEQPQQMCCRECSVRVFILQGMPKNYYWGKHNTHNDSVFMGGWQDSIDKVKAMDLCPQCGEIHPSSSEKESVE